MILLVQIQAILALAGVFALLVIRFTRMKWDAHVAKVKPGYMDWILSEIGGAFRTVEPVPGQKPKIRKIPAIDHNLVRDLIIEVIGSFQGKEREPLVILYEISGFLREDIRLLRTGTFSKRIRALARIESVRPHNCAELIRPLTGDASPFIRFAAIRFLITSGDGTYEFTRAELNEIIELRRFDVLLEILRVLSKSRHRIFFEFLAERTLPLVREICLHIVLKERIVEAIPYVRSQIPRMLRDERLNVKWLELHIDCLSLEPSVENETLLQGLSKNSIDAVRAAAYRGLLRLRPDLVAEYIVAALDDLSPEVRRIGQEEFSKTVRTRAA